MNCPICKHGIMNEGFTTLVFEKDNSTIIIKKVPANVCGNCNESFVSEDISKSVFKIIQNEEKKGLEVEVLHYVAA